MKRSAIFCAALLLPVLILGPARPLEGREPARQGTESKERQEALQKLRERFRKQDKKDELVLLTQNSFFPGGMAPIAGRPVLMAVGVVPWGTSYIHDCKNVVEVGIKKGGAFLEKVPDYGLEEPDGKVRLRSLETTVGNALPLLFWLVTDPSETGEVALDVSLLPKGERGEFIDPKPLRIVVKPLAPRPGDSMDVLKQREAEYENARKPRAKLVESYSFNVDYSGSGAVSFARLGLLQEPNEMLVFQKEEGGEVTKAAPATAAAQYRDLNERWRYVPYGLKGLVTHREKKGARWGVTALFRDTENRSFYENKLGAQCVDFSEYDPNFLRAGPRRSWRLRMPFSKDGLLVQNPQLARDVCSRPISQNEVCEWGVTRELFAQPLSGDPGPSRPKKWETRVVRYLRTGDLPKPEALRKLLVAEKGPAIKDPFRRPISTFSVTWGFIFQDPDAEIERKLPVFGHPNGPVVTTVEPESPAEQWRLLSYDILRLVDGQPTDSSQELSEILRGADLSQGVEAVFWRDGVLMEGWAKPK